MNNPNLTGKTNTTGNNVNQNGEQREKFTIKVTKKEEFPHLLESSVMPLTDIMEKVSEVFGAAYKDFVGCYIKPYETGYGFSVNLFFSKPVIDNTGLTYAFQVNNGQDPAKSNPNGSSIIATIHQMQSRASQKIYSITDHGKEGLEKFILNNFKDKNGKVNWGQCCGEVPNGNGGVLAVVTNLDLYKIIQEIYGDKDEDGSYVQYQINPIRPIAPNPMSPAGVSSNYLVVMLRASVNEINKAAAKAGMVTNCGVPMYSYTRK